MTVSCSKADPFGIVWGAKPIFLEYIPTATVNAARQLQQLELLVPCSGGDRVNTPLFVNPETAKCFTYSELDRVMHLVLIKLVGETEAKLYSWHRYAHASVPTWCLMAARCWQFSSIPVHGAPGG